MDRTVNEFTRICEVCDLEDIGECANDDVNRYSHTFRGRRNPLILATDMGEVEAVRILLERGANPNVCVGNFTPLLIACQNGNEVIATLLLRYNSSVNVVDGGEWTPLHFAVIQRNLSMVN